MQIKPSANLQQFGCGMAKIFVNLLTAFKYICTLCKAVFMKYIIEYYTMHLFWLTLDRCALKVIQFQI